MKFVKHSPAPDLSVIAEEYVAAHSRHVQALEKSSLAYVDQLMEVLRRRQPDWTIREIASEVMELVPDLTEEQVFCLAQTKFLGFCLDSLAA